MVATGGITFAYLAHTASLYANGVEK